MKRIIRAEFYKFMHRKETYIIIFLMLLAFGLPIGFKLAPASYSLDYAFGDGRLPCSGYMVLGYAFWGTLGVFVLLFSVLCVSLSSKEIETHYYYLYFPRVSEREKVYIVKLMILLCFVVTWYLAYTLLLNPIGYKLLCSFRPDMACPEMSDGSMFYWVSMWIMNLAELVFYICLVSALGTKLKSLATISVVMVIYYASMFIYDFPLICYILPEYYKQTAMKIEDLSLKSELWTYTIIFLLLTTAYDVLLFLYGKKNYKKIDA